MYLQDTIVQQQQQQRRRYKNRHCFCKLPLAVGKSEKAEKVWHAPLGRPTASFGCCCCSGAWAFAVLQLLLLLLQLHVAVALCGGRRRHLCDECNQIELPLLLDLPQVVVYRLYRC